MADRSIEDRALHWLSGRDTGASSKAIAAHMLGREQKGHVAYPSDESDFGRCHRLLKLIPEWRQRLPEMAKHSEAWAALVACWPDLERRFEAGEKIYDDMKAALRGPEERDQNLVRLGPGISMRFGRSS